MRGPGPPPHTRPVSAAGMAGRPIRLTWGPTRSPYGFHISRLVLTFLSFLATVPSRLWERGSEAILSEGCTHRLAEGTGKENTSQACAEAPRRAPCSDSPHPPLSFPGSQPLSLCRPCNDSVMSALSSQRRTAWGIWQRTKAMSSVWSGGGGPWALPGYPWAAPSLSCSSTVGPLVSSSTSNWSSRNKNGSRKSGPSCAG